MFQQALLNDGGAKRDRTADILRARQALSQLSYSPIDDNFLKFPILFQTRHGFATHSLLCEPES